MIKRLSGGLILLCLASISLGVTSGEVSITDPDVLEQLKELRTFIDVNRDFTKGFKNLKPVLVEYRSSASKFNGIALGNLSFNTDALHMSIGVNTIQSDGKMLSFTIKVVYEWVDYIGYQVSSAKLTAWETLATGDGTFTGDVGVGGDLEVTGNAILPEINGEENPSVKPLYWHGIAMADTGITNIHLQCVIINNSSELFDKTSLKNLFESFALSQAGAVINLSGTIYDADAEFDSPVTYAMFLYNVGGVAYCEISGSNLNGHGRITKNYTLDDFFDLLDATYGVNDRMNKLN